jgi:hypothetical protein
LARRGRSRRRSPARCLYSIGYQQRDFPDCRHAGGRAPRGADGRGASPKETRTKQTKRRRTKRWRPRGWSSGRRSREGRAGKLQSVRPSIKGTIAAAINHEASQTKSHHIARAHHTAIAVVAPASANADASPCRAGEAAAVLGICEMAPDFLRPIQRTYAQVGRDREWIDHLARVHFPIGVPDRLELPKCLNEFRPVPPAARHSQDG